MDQFPELKTERLLLRGFSIADKQDVLELAGVKEIAAKTLSIPHPLEPEDAENWLKDKRNNYRKNKEVAWAICARPAGQLIGAVGLKLNDKNESAELGFWMGKPYWGKGYVTEASQEVIHFGFEVLKLNRIEAHHMVGNKASGRVLEKLGLQYEGLHRQRIKKWDEFKDVKCYAILRSDR